LKLNFNLTSPKLPLLVGELPELYWIL